MLFRSLSLDSTWPLIKKTLSYLIYGRGNRINLKFNIYILNQNKIADYYLKFDSIGGNATKEYLKEIITYSENNKDIILDICHFNHMPFRFGVIINRRCLFVNKQEWKPDPLENKSYLKISMADFEKYIKNDANDSNFLISEFINEMKNCEISSRNSLNTY